MRKVIDGIRYDTEKASFIGNASYSHKGDFHHWDEDLYKAPRSGRYFIAGSGGPMTKYSHKIEQNSWTGGERVIPLTAEQARGWCEQYLAENDWEEFFADQIQDA